MPTAADPQTLNRYSNCGNNPLNRTDPSGHDAGISAIIIAVVVSVTVNVAMAAAQGGNIGPAVATGVVSGLLGVGGAFIGSTVLAGLGPFWGAVIGGAIGGAAGGAASAAMSGGNIGLGALAGGIGGAIGGGIGFKTQNWGKGWGDLAARAAMSVLTGSMGGGIAAAIAGGNVWQGMAWGGAGAAMAFAATVALSGDAPKKAAEVNEDHPTSGGGAPKTREVSRIDPLDPLKRIVAKDITESAEIRPMIDAYAKEFNVDASKLRVYEMPIGGNAGFTASGDTIILHPEALRRYGFVDRVSLLGHEMTHAFFQWKAAPNFLGRYVWQTLAHGYFGNSFEVQAETIGARFATSYTGRYVAPDPHYVPPR